MSYKTGRNDPCPCGSGRKYKHCCDKPTAPVSALSDSHEFAVGRAIAWLEQRHRRAFGEALRTEIEETVFDILGDEDETREALAGLTGDLLMQIQINFTEWLLAEGDIEVKGEFRRVSELLVGPGGPLLSTGQRAWLEQLARRPLRLYDVTEVVPGSSITLCDAIDTSLPPCVVNERAGSRTLRVGTQIGARVMELTGEHQLSGAIFPFSAWSGRALQQRLRALAASPGAHEEDDILAIGAAIIDAWLEQYLVPAPLPEIINSSTGEPLMFITDHYEVQDWDALTSALAAQPDVHGDRDSDWSRLIDCEDGLTRSQATIAPESGGRRVSVSYKTAGLAQQGRAWFDALAGGSVKFLLQEVSDPKGLLSRDGASAPQARAVQPLPKGMDAESLAGAIETVLKRSYANWADEPIPVLDGQTPRLAIQSAAGLERVKGLLRSYEDGETRQAALQARREISYQFLWDALGLRR